MNIFRPTTLNEALEICADTRVTPFAGGTDIMVKGLRGSGLAPDLSSPALFLGGIDELKTFRDDGDSLFIGSCVTYTDLLSFQSLPNLLKQAILEIGSPGIRNLGTLGGNVCNASPAGDTLPVLYIFDSLVHIAGPGGTRNVPIEEFIQGPGSTSLSSGELVTGITIRQVSFTHEFYRKVGTRRANALSKLSCAACAVIADQRIEDFRVAFGAVAPRVIRPRDAEAQVRSMKRAELKSEVERIVETCSAHMNPIDDQRSTAAYRKRTAEALLQFFMESLV